MLMSLLPASTSDRNDFEMPVASATCPSASDLLVRSRFRLSPSRG
jgi:hypothetical protein